MGRPSARADVSGLSIRIISAVLLAPPVLLALYGGPPFSDLLVLLAGVGMALEGARVATSRTRGVVHLALPGILAVATGLAAVGSFAGAFAVLAVGALAVVGHRRNGTGAILAAGLVYLGMACTAFIWLRDRPESGLSLVFWLLAIVWATDVGAYFFGRSLRGPRLAPRLSPNKTWAGLLGGMLCAGLVGALGARALAAWTAGLPFGGDIATAAAGALLAGIAQAGDLLESAFKRHFKVKDTGSLIPGHGGILDRADGLLASGLALALAVRVIQGGP